MNASDRPTSTGDHGCYFFHFGLIVTGVSERDHLPKMMWKPISIYSTK